MIVHRIERKPAVCDPPAPNTPQSNFDIFAETWAEQYGFFREKKTDWKAVVAANRSKVTDATTPEQLFEIIAGMISPLNDAHSSISAPAITKRFGGVRRSPSYLDAPDRAQALGLVTRRLTAPLTPFCNGQLELGMLAPDIGYLRIRSFTRYTAQGSFESGLAALEAALDTAFASAKTWKGLVIDVRVNGGGADPYGLAIARRLTPVTYTAYVKQARNDPYDDTKWSEPQPSVVQPSTRPGFHGPVVELTGVQSISAAETFTQALMDRKPHVTRVGETTQGVFSDVLLRQLPNGWLFSLANERFVTDGKSYDNVGIAPDIAVESFTPAARATGRDAAVERAIAIIRGS
jgi:C-terminal processing protease CtpA/Prc